MNAEDVTFTDGSRLASADVAEALYRCYGDFEVRMAALARARGEPWVPQRDDKPSAEHLAEHVKLHHLDFANSVIGIDRRGQVVAIALLGRRGTEGWLGDFAVAPSHRDQGLGRRLLQAFLTSARRCGVREVSFDVLAVNAPAIRTYEGAGFVAAGEYHELLGSSEELGGSHIDAEVPPADAARLTDRYNRMLADGEPRPCWERALPALLADSDLQSVSCSIGGEERGLLAYRLAEGGGGRRIALMSAWFVPNAGSSELRAMLGAAAGPAPALFRAGLEPADSRFAALLRELGFRPGRRALEMRMRLDER